MKIFLEQITLRSFVQYLIYFFPFVFFLRSGALNLFLVILIVAGFILIHLNKIKIYLNNIDVLFFLFFLTIIFSSSLNIEIIGYENFLKSIFLLRFFFLYLLVKTLAANKLIDFKKLSLVCCISALILSFDIFTQHLFGKDMFQNRPHDYRYNGLFGTEAVAGSYIHIFCMLSIFFLVEKKIKFFFKIIILTFFGLGISASFDRTPYLMYIFFIILLSIFLDKKFFFVLLLNLIFFIFLFNTNSIFNNRYFKLYKSIENALEISIDDKKKISENNTTQIKIIVLENYFNIYLTTFEVSKKNLLFGSGHKSFRILCPEIIINTEEYKKVCSLHPHHLYLEIFSTSGVISLILFIMFLCGIFFNIFLRCENKKYKVIFFIILLVELFPLRPYGSVLSSFHGTMIWLLLSIISSQLAQVKDSNKTYPK